MLNQKIFFIADMECYPDDSECAIDLLSFFLYPICKMSDRFVWRGDVSKSNTGNIKKTSANDGFQGDLHAILEEQHMREFYVWMNDYVQVLESIFPENDYLQCFDEEIYAKPPFEKSIPIVMKFVHTILYDKEEVYDKWHLLMKFMIEPYAGLYPKRQMLQNR